MITFSESSVKKFRHFNKSKRWGQAFYDFMKLDKVDNQADKRFCDKLYNEVDELKAKKLIASRTQKGQ